MAASYDRKRTHTLKKRYGITAEVYDSLLEKQGGVCACCGKAPEKLPGNFRALLHVDHDHQTGDVRGLLCAFCNWFIGGVERGLQPLAEAYLKRPRPNVNALRVA
jgi:hypothetical protein